MKKIIITSAILFTLSTTNSNSSTGEQALRQVITWYNNTTNNCGSAVRPAFLCSGIMLRAVETNPDFLPWDPAPSAIANGGISFSWLRADNNFSSLVYTYENGYIFYPALQAPASKSSDIPYLCAFPMDADSFSRDSNGCGASTAYPQESRPCNQIGITTANQWINLFNTPGANRYRIQCGWDVRQGQPDTARRFTENIASRNLINNNFWGIQNEMRVKTWAQGLGKTLPLHSFFYIRNNAAALDNARYDQRRFYNLYNEVLPIIEIAIPRNRSENAFFRFIERSQEIGAGEIVSSTSPEIPMARGADNNQLWKSNYYAMSALTVRIPVYRGMEKGQSVRLTWHGPNSMLNSTQTRTITDVGDIFFTIPRPNVLDAIGSTAQIAYSVRDLNGTITNSRKMSLSVERQSMTLPIAQINTSTRRVTIRYPEMNDRQIVNLYWYGSRTRVFGTQVANNSGTVTYDIPEQWMRENKGNRVSLIYSVAPRRGDRYDFSRVLLADIN